MELPFIFPDLLNHDEFAEQVEHHLMMQHNFTSEVISAGFCNFIASDPKCSGKSETLKLASRGEIDDNVIKMFNYQQGMI